MNFLLPVEKKSNLFEPDAIVQWVQTIGVIQWFGPWSCGMESVTFCHQTGTRVFCWLHFDALRQNWHALSQSEHGVQQSCGHLLHTSCWLPCDALPLLHDVEPLPCGVLAVSFLICLLMFQSSWETPLWDVMGLV